RSCPDPFGLTGYASGGRQLIRASGGRLPLVGAMVGPAVAPVFIAVGTGARPRSGAEDFADDFGSRYRWCSPQLSHFRCLVRLFRSLVCASSESLPPSRQRTAPSLSMLALCISTSERRVPPAFVPPTMLARTCPIVPAARSSSRVSRGAPIAVPRG